MTEHAVVIAGGGPAGMMLAAELALAKVDVAVVERRPDHVLVGSRAGGVHSRTIEVTEEPELGVRHDAIGVHGLGRLEYEIRDGEVVYMDGGPVRVLVTERQLGPPSEPTLRDLSEALVAVYGTDFGIHNPTWISR